MGKNTRRRKGKKPVVQAGQSSVAGWTDLEYKQRRTSLLCMVNGRCYCYNVKGVYSTVVQVDTMVKICLTFHEIKLSSRI